MILKQQQFLRIIVHPKPRLVHPYSKKFPQHNDKPHQSNASTYNRKVVRIKNVNWNFSCHSFHAVFFAHFVLLPSSISFFFLFLLHFFIYKFFISRDTNRWLIISCTTFGTEEEKKCKSIFVLIGIFFFFLLLNFLSLSCSDFQQIFLARRLQFVFLSNLVLSFLN